MHAVTIAQAKNHFSSLIHSVELGQEVVLTRHGKPVVRLVAEQPIQAAQSQSQLEAIALSNLSAARSRLKGKVSFSDWKNLRDEGRLL
ncbi:MAG: Prevent-host-death family protein [Comamonadaceae bacterium]|nr:MAG: Prevent-host-death family protein [Comamonadaceae bacterium]